MGPIEVYDAKKLDVLDCTMDLHTGYCNKMVVSGDGQNMITLGNEAIVGYWDLTEFLCSGSLKQSEIKWHQAAFSPTDTYIALLGDDEDTKKNIIEILDRETGDVLFSHSTTTIKTSIAWHPKLEVLVVGGEVKSEGHTTFIYQV